MERYEAVAVEPESAGLSRTLLAVAAAWALSVGFDIFLHAGLLARIYAKPSPFLLGPEEAFRRIPFGYITFLVLTISLYWFLRRLGIRGTKAGFQHRAGTDAVVWGALFVSVALTIALQYLGLAPAMKVV